MSDARTTLARRLADAKIATPALDARLLVETATGMTHEQLLFDAARPLPPKELECLQDLTRRRLQGEPVSRLRGEREFFGLPFFIDDSTLDPRPDTETLVELALAFATGCPAGMRILDLGTGCGAIAISLLSALPHATATATDIDPRALDVARRNARRHGVEGRLELRRANWCDGLAGPFDIIVSNPPYIASSRIAGLAPEVARFDPSAALDGGVDGLDAYRAIAGDAARIVAPHGFLAVEIGAGQEDGVSGIFRHAGWLPVGEGEAHALDLAGRVRALGFVRQPEARKLGVGNPPAKG